MPIGGVVTSHYPFLQESRNESLEENKSELEKRIDDLLKRLQEAWNLTNIEEAYKREISTQVKLAEIHKGNISQFSPFLAVLGQTSKDSSSNVISPSGYEHYFIRT